jgi:hypothetical protein
MVTVTVITTVGVADADIIMDGIAGTTTMGSESRLTQGIRSASAAFLEGWPLARCVG